jgi:hypothetical protein
MVQQVKSNAANNKLFQYGGLAAAVIVLLLLFVFPTYLNDYRARAGGVWNVLGIILLIVSAVMAWNSYKWATGGFYYAAWIACIALAIAVACGFNFSMFGISERP